MAFSDFPKLASGFYKFVYGLMGWNEALDANFEKIGKDNEEIRAQLAKKANLSVPDALNWDNGNLRIEKGTWVPTLVGDVNPGSHSYMYQIGEYTLNGDEVSLHFYLYITAVDPTMLGNLWIGGLPFASTNDRAAGSIFYSWGFKLPTGLPNMHIGIINRDNRLLLHCTDYFRADYLSPDELSNPVSLQASIRYKIS